MVKTIVMSILAMQKKSSVYVKKMTKQNAWGLFRVEQDSGTYMAIGSGNTVAALQEFYKND
jgi:hypothetical protein